jgi:hypothetical protein
MDASVDSLPYYDKELEIPGKSRFPLTCSSSSYWPSRTYHILSYLAGLKDLVKSEVDKEMKRMSKVGLDDPRVPADMEPFVRDNRFDKYPSTRTS